MMNLDVLNAKSILIPMDNTQKNHLKSYGIIYNHLKNGQNEMRWCLNYLGGSFLINYDANLYEKIIFENDNLVNTTRDFGRQLLENLDGFKKEELLSLVNESYDTDLKKDQEN